MYNKLSTITFKIQLSQNCWNVTIPKYLPRLLKVINNLSCNKNVQQTKNYHI